MNKRNHIRTVLSLVLVFFLFVPIVIRSLPSHSNDHVRGIGLYKASSTPTKADIQLPYEEKEKEEEISSDSASALFYFFLSSELIHSDLIKDSCFAYNTTKPLAGPIPLYLAKRSILI
ncbi:MAG TPA: hypothetical protein PL167_13845 [Cyclobacteriaceae bacterium]|nr:hypothetical protein [Cyclobacteriaceae bacterium]